MYSTQVDSGSFSGFEVKLSNIKTLKYFALPPWALLKERKLFPGPECFLQSQDDRNIPESSPANPIIV